jgi:redox-sensitive bicupin YhaK (pirin superfamily)
LELPAAATVTLPVPLDDNFVAHLLDGKVETANGFSYESRTLLDFRQNGEAVTSTGEAPLPGVLPLGGLPLGAPLAKHGPFVMNTQTEILEAMRDYNREGWAYTLRINRR